MMKKILKLGIILIILSVVSGCRNNDESLNQKSGKVIENTNVKMELEVRKKANDLFNRLIESGQFNEFEFINFENVIGWTSNTTRETIRYEVRYSKKNKTTFERNDLLLSYNSFGELRVVDLTCEYSVNCSNEKLAIIYLDEFDIKESDFDNMNEVDTYQHFLRILSNTTTSEETRSVITTKDKDLLISGGLIDEGLSITKMSVDDF